MIGFVNFIIILILKFGTFEDAFDGKIYGIFDGLRTETSQMSSGNHLRRTTRQ